MRDVLNTDLIGAVAGRMQGSRMVAYWCARPEDCSLADLIRAGVPEMGGRAVALGVVGGSQWPLGMMGGEKEDAQRACRGPKEQQQLGGQRIVFKGQLCRVRL